MIMRRVGEKEIDGSEKYLIFFVDLQDYSKGLSRQINAAAMNQMFKSYSHEFRTSLNCMISLT
jgi:signal transduction histidine kinase